jgi:hypothetical protein
MTDPPPIRFAVSTSRLKRRKFGMTYGYEQVRLEIRDARRGLPDELVNFIVSGS